MTTEFDQRRDSKAPVDREKLTAGITSDLVELPDEALWLVRMVVGEMLEAERRRGTARRIDGAGLAEAQRQREAAL